MDSEADRQDDGGVKDAPRPSREFLFIWTNSDGKVVLRTPSGEKVIEPDEPGGKVYSVRVDLQ